MTTSPRITARVNVETQALLQRAAALSGISSINSFVLSSAIEKATQIIAHAETIHLSSADTLMFLNALDRPAKANAKLHEAQKAYAKKML